uniref:polyketide synthase family protein n=1 Tax=Burkholderia sp. Ac-20379 TaxID=2703900 RepID=UPI00197FB7C1
FDAATLAARWVAGAALDWARLYGEPRLRAPRRVALPTYPFASKRFWLPQAEAGAAAASGAAAVSAAAVAAVSGAVSGAAVASAAASAAAAAATSVAATPASQAAPGLSLREIGPNRYARALDASAFYLDHHRVGGQPILPGVAYLELIRAAVQRAGMGALPIRHVVWLKPMVVTGQATVEVEIIDDGGGWPRAEVHCVDASGVRQLHAQARLATDGAAPAANAHEHARFDAARARRYDAQHVYTLFSAMGIEYGPGHRAIENLALDIDEQGAKRVLAQLRLPADIAASEAAFVLHPSLMDGAFQAALGMALDASGAAPAEAALPFALDSVEILAPCSAEMRVSIVESRDAPANPRVRTLDLELRDAADTVCVRMHGFATRVRPSDDAPTQLLLPAWRPVPADDLAPAQADDAMRVDPARFDERRVLLCDVAGVSAAALEARLPGWGCGALAASSAAPEQRYGDAVERLLAEVQRLARQAPRTALLQVVVPAGGEALLAGLSGLLDSAAREVPALCCQYLGCEPGCTADELAALLRRAASQPRLS